MLHEQLFRQSSGDARVSVAAAGVSASFGAPSREDTLDEKLRQIEGELRARGLVGSLDEPNEYVMSTMRMRWGLFDDAGTRGEGAPALVYFGGLNRAGPVIVGLGGSSSNVVGHDGATGTHSRSNAAAIVRWMLAGIGGNNAPDFAAWGDMDGELQEVLEGVAIALHYLRPPTQDLQFFAKVLLMGTIHRLEQ